jgi:hypothetical protein
VGREHVLTDRHKLAIASVIYLSLDIENFCASDHHKLDLQGACKHCMNLLTKGKVSTTTLQQ